MDHTISIANKNSIKIVEVLSRGRDYFNEIHKKTGIGSKNNLLKNLDLLVSNKILIKEEKVANTYYSLNYSNSVTIAVLNLINQAKFEKLPFNIKKSISECVLAVKPAMAVLFGSYAKGNYMDGSDIDLLLFGNTDGKKNEIREISKRFGVQINAVFMEFEELNHKTESLKHIFKTGYPVTGEVHFYNELKEI